MPTKLTRNIFSGGLNTDTDKNSIQPNVYTEAHNLELVGEGVFSALKPMLGTSALELILSSATGTVLRVIDNYYNIEGTTNVKCLTIFTASATAFKIWCYDIQNADLYELHEKTVDGSYITVDRIVDAKSYGENGIDILYFVDNNDELKQLRCEILSYAPNFLSEADLSVQRRGANGTIDLTTDCVTVGGTLLSGSYQFAYRMVDPDTKRFTKWSSLTNPVIIYNESDDTSYRVTAGIGLYTNKKITFTVSPTQEELDTFAFFQLCVVENIYPIAESATLPASLLPIEPVANLTGFEYKSNTKVNTFPIEDVVVDLAAIKTAKTLNVQQNRMFLGNIEYHSLVVDDPTVTGTILTEPVYNSTDISFTATKSGVQTLVYPILDEVITWNGLTGNRYTHSGATVLMNFNAQIEFTITAGVPTDYIYCRIVKNGSTVLTEDYVFMSSNYTFNLAVIGVTMEATDYVEVQFTADGSDGIGPNPPAITIEIDTAGTFDNDGAATVEYKDNQKGYFRDEVYRYAIVYRDKYGNKAAPKILDMTGVTGNATAQVGHKDMRFPSRYDTGYEILDATDIPQAIGLSLTIDNHPSWAVGFEIVRVKRKKRVLFQTPVVPMSAVKGVGALSNYPSKQYSEAEDDSTATTTDYPDAQPQTSDDVWVPKNMLWPELRDVVEVTTDVGAAPNKRNKGESKLKPRTTFGDSRYVSKYDLCAVFPQQTIYGDTPYFFSGGEEIETVDFALLKADVNEFNTTLDSVNGDDVNTELAATLYGLKQDDYFSTNNTTLPPLEGDCKHNAKVTEYLFLDNYSTGGLIGGKLVMKYDLLQTSGITWGFKPTVNKMAIVKLDSSLDDNHILNFASGVRNAFHPSTPASVVDSSTYDYEAESATTNNFITEYTGFTENSNYFQAVRIANIANNNITDDRYGDVDDQHEFISTGASYACTVGQLVTVAAEGSVPITLDVWGGDCFISYHVFKIHDRTHMVVAQAKSAFNVDYYNNKMYLFGAGDNPGTQSPISLPLGVKGAAQFIQVYLESEYNGEALDADVLKATAAEGNVPVLNILDRASVTTPLTYNYNINVSKQNDQKVYFPKPQYSFEQNDFPARFVWSEPKIYNSDTQGFDVFKVLNFYDLGEDKGGITKLAIAGDSMYAVQERKVTYIPTGQNQLQQTDAGTLAVGTSDVVGRPITIDANRGGQHLAGIVETGGVIYIPDNLNKTVYALSGQQLQPIALNNETLFRSLFATTIDERNVRSVYDPIRRQYWLITTTNCYVFNERGMWTANLEFGARLLGGVYTNQNLYLIGKSGNDIYAYSMYTGTLNEYIGTIVTPRVTIVINPDVEMAKTFDNMLFASTDRLDEVDITVERESELGDQTVLGMNIDASQKEGNYRLATMRDSDSARLRGLRAIATVKWKTSIQSTLSSILTKIRLSSRTPF